MIFAFQDSNEAGQLLDEVKLLFAFRGRPFARKGLFCCLGNRAEQPSHRTGFIANGRIDKRPPRLTFAPVGSANSDREVLNLRAFAGQRLDYDGLYCGPDNRAGRGRCYLCET